MPKHTHATGIGGSQKNALVALELELQEVVSQPTWMLGIEPWGPPEELEIKF